MRIIYIQSYPLYHDNVTDTAWLKMENRDKWMPGITAGKGAEVEIWAVGDRNGVHVYTWGGHEIKIRIFERPPSAKKTKFHFSPDLIWHARSNHADHYVIKGVDGGVGVELIRQYLIPMRIPFSFVIGGKCVSPYHKEAEFIFYESDLQHSILTKSRWPFFKGLPPEKLVKLPKSVDTEKFKPEMDASREYDIITMGRLIPYYKNYDAIFKLAQRFRVAVIGGGELLDAYRSKFPHIDWIGHVDHKLVPSYLSKGKVFFYSSTRDFFPRAIAEAVSCGLPIAAFGKSISSDVVRPEFGVLLNQKGYADQLSEFLSDADRLKKMRVYARDFALLNWHKRSSEPAVEILLRNARPTK